MAEQLNDLRKLVEEAAREGYDPRANKCWPWSHRWTMWEERSQPGYTHLKCQMRRCVRCGKLQKIDFW